MNASLRNLAWRFVLLWFELFRTIGVFARASRPADAPPARLAFADRFGEKDRGVLRAGVVERLSALRIAAHMACRRSPFLPSPTAANGRSLRTRNVVQQQRRSCLAVHVATARSSERRPLDALSIDAARRCQFARFETPTTTQAPRCFSVFPFLYKFHRFASRDSDCRTKRQLSPLFLPKSKHDLSARDTARIYVPAAGVFVALFAILLTTQLIRCWTSGSGSIAPGGGRLARLCGPELRPDACFQPFRLHRDPFPVSRSYRDSEMVVWFSAAAAAWVRPVMAFMPPLVFAIAGLRCLSRLGVVAKRRVPRKPRVAEGRGQGHPRARFRSRLRGRPGVFVEAVADDETLCQEMP